MTNRKEGDMTYTSRPPVLIEVPKFPKDAALRQGTFRKYHDLLLQHETRGACQHGFAAMLSMMSLAVDASHRGDWMGTIPGRIYGVSVGDTGTYKSVQSNPVAQLWGDISADGEHLGQLSGYTTDAGLFKTLAGHPNEPTFGMFDELQELLQGKELRGSVLTYYLNSLYNAPAVLQRNLSALNQKKLESKIEGPIFAFHGNIQLRAFWNAVGTSFEQVCNGFLNRICYFPADESDHYFMRSRPFTESDLRLFKTHFNDIKSRGRTGGRGVGAGVPQKIKLGQDAGRLWDTFNKEWDDKLRDHYYGPYRDMVARNRDHCARIALIYCADENLTVVTESQMESAIAVARYLEESIVYIVKHHDVSEGPQRISSIEENAIRFLKKLTRKTGKPPEDFEKGWIKLKDIREQFNSANRPNSDELRKIIERNELVDLHMEPQWRANRYRYNDSDEVWQPPLPSFDEDAAVEGSK